jgi:elongation factor 1-gamma
MGSFRRYGDTALRRFVEQSVYSQDPILEAGPLPICLAFFLQHRSTSTVLPKATSGQPQVVLERALNTLEKVLETNTFLVGERLTLADISVSHDRFARGKSLSWTTAIFPSISSVVRFVETVLNQPSDLPVLGPVQWPEKALTYSPPPKDTKKKEDKPKAAPAEKPKKQEKPKAKESEPEEEDDLVPKEEPKPKHPLDSLPKSTFNLEDWKRAYSNKDTKGPGGSIEWFYEQ